MMLKLNILVKNDHNCHDYQISSNRRNLHCKVSSHCGSSRTGQMLPAAKMSRYNRSQANKWMFAKQMRVTLDMMTLLTLSTFMNVPFPFTLHIFKKKKKTIFWMRLLLNWELGDEKILCRMQSPHLVPQQSARFQHQPQTSFCQFYSNTICKCDNSERTSFSTLGI